MADGGEENYNFTLELKKEMFMSIQPHDMILATKLYQNQPGGQDAHNRKTIK